MTIELFSTNDQYSEEMHMLAYTATASRFFFISPFNSGKHQVLICFVLVS